MNSKFESKKILFRNKAIMYIKIGAMLFIVYLNYKINNTIKRKKEEIINVQQDINFWKSKDEIQNKIESLRISSAWFEDTCAWNDLIEYNVGNILCLYYSDIHCLTCVDAEIKKIQEFEKNIDSKKIILLADYNFEKDFIVFQKLNQLKFTSFKINRINIPINIRELKMPCYFILDKNLSIKLVFIPNKQDPIKTEEYFDLIKYTLNES